MVVYIFKIIILLLVAVSAIVIPYILIFRRDLDHILHDISQHRYDTTKLAENGNKVYSLINWIILTSFVVGMAFATILLKWIM